ITRVCWLVAIGTALGLLGSLGLTRGLEALLYSCDTNRSRVARDVRGHHRERRCSLQHLAHASCHTRRSARRDADCSTRTYHRRDRFSRSCCRIACPLCRRPAITCAGSGLTGAGVLMKFFGEISEIPAQAVASPTIRTRVLAL